MSIDQMRLEYTRYGLAESDLDADPIVQFRKWFDDAAAGDKPSWLEANAMTLATAEPDGRVSCRVVLLKGIEEEKFLFFTNYDSLKGRQIADNPQAALCFHWPHLERQVRITGTVEATSRETSVAYFRSRPYISRLGAIVSDQSAEVASRDELDRRMTELQNRYGENDEIPCPERWGGYALTPDALEFWQGRIGRVHDRLLYRKSDAGWKIVRLAP